MIHVGQISNDQADAKELFKFAHPKGSSLTAFQQKAVLAINSAF